MANPFAMFGTDKTLEVNGIYVNYGDFRVLVARSGGSNQEFNRLRTALAKPFLRLIAAGTLPEEKQNELNHKLYAQAVVRGFEVLQEKGKKKEWVSGIPTPDGGLVEFNEQNLIALFNQLPDLFADLQRVAADHTQYLVDTKEAVTGN